MIKLVIKQEIFKPMACKNTDIIARLEEKLYNEYLNIRIIILI